MTDSVVFDLLQLDKELRDIKNKDSLEEDIFHLGNITFDNDWDYSLPTIPAVNNNLRNQRLRDINSFNTLFNKRYDMYFSHVNFDNILIAGGAVTSILFNQNWINDVDIFVYGLTVREADMKVEKLIKQIYESYKISILDNYIKEHNNIALTDNEIDIITQNVTVTNFRNQYCITMRFSDDQEIQIILRLYKSISEILHGFDIGSCAMGYDSKNVYFISLSKFSYEYLANIIDPSRRSTTYEARLIKYYNRGF